jgi:hypothetical protein
LILNVRAVRLSFSYLFLFSLVSSLVFVLLPLVLPHLQTELARQWALPFFILFEFRPDWIIRP